MNKISRQLINIARDLMGAVNVRMTNNEQKLATALKLHVFGSLSSISGDANLICQLPNGKYFIAQCEGVVEDVVLYTCYVCNKIHPITGAMSADASKVGEISQLDNENKCAIIAQQAFSAI